MNRSLLLGLTLGLTLGPALGGCAADPDAATPGTGDPGDQPAPASCAPMAARLWKLTPSQYSSTVAALIPGAGAAGARLSASLPQGEGRFSGVAATLAMSQPHVDELWGSAEALAAQALADPGRLFPCLGPAIDDPACVRAFLADFGARALRRPLRDEERARYQEFYGVQAAAFGARTALSLLVRAFLLSPEFLYRTELGDDAAPGEEVALTPYERASALSYFLLDGPPDEELLQAASRGELATKEQISAQTRRLLARPEQARGVERFFTELLQLSDVTTLRKTQLYFPTFNSRVAADLGEETRRFVRYVLWQDGGHLSTLLTAGYSLLNKRLADYYGVTGAAGEDFVRVEFPAGQRAGILTQGSWLSTLATEKETRPVARGKFVRERLLCQAIPPPPPNVNAVPIGDNHTRTQRERLARHAADGTCSGCHALMDPIGLSLENFDAAGLFRTVEYDKPIDATGVLKLDSQELRYEGAAGLGATLTGTAQLGACFSRSLYEYAAGQAPELCDADELTSAFAASSGDVLDLMVRITTAPRFFLRQRGAKE